MGKQSGPSGSQEQPGGPRRTQEDPGGPRTQVEPGRAGPMTQGEPGGPRIFFLGIVHFWVPIDKGRMRRATRVRPTPTGLHRAPYWPSRAHQQTSLPFSSWHRAHQQRPSPPAGCGYWPLGNPTSAIGSPTSYSHSQLAGERHLRHLCPRTLKALCVPACSKGCPAWPLAPVPGPGPWPWSLALALKHRHLGAPRGT